MGFLCSCLCISAVGAPRPSWRELDDDVMLSSFIVGDSVESAKNEAGDVVLSKVKQTYPF